jgi:cbb3-type cytochrome oxidase subunit 3
VEPFLGQLIFIFIFILLFYCCFITELGHVARSSFSEAWELAFNSKRRKKKKRKKASRVGGES